MQFDRNTLKGSIELVKVVLTRNNKVVTTGSEEQQASMKYVNSLLDEALQEMQATLITDVIEELPNTPENIEVPRV